MKTPIGPRWHVFQNLPQREQEAASELEKQGFEILAPRLLKRVQIPANMTARQKLRQKMKPLVPVPLFPGYGFVRFDRDRDQWRCINGTRNVTKLLMADENTPLPVPDEQMDRIIKMIGPDGLIHEIDQEEPWRKVDGKMVRILDGAFADYVGLCRKSDDRRVKVLFHIMGRRVEKTLTYEEVEIA